MSDFHIVKIIGKGAFGEVRIVKHKTSEEVFAMKTMEKKNDDIQKSIRSYCC